MLVQWEEVYGRDQCQSDRNDFFGFIQKKCRGLLPRTLLGLLRSLFGSGTRSTVRKHFLQLA
jgi:hypothetical protein